MRERYDEGQKPGTAATLVEERPAAAGSEAIRQDIETTRVDLDEKLDALQDRLRMAKARAKQIFDLRYQAERHPWALLGASVAAGFVAGSLGHVEGKEHATPVSMAAEGLTQHPRDRPRTLRRELLEMLKLAVGAALKELACQEIHRHMPALGLQLEKVREGRRAQLDLGRRRLARHRPTEDLAQAREHESLAGNACAHL